MIRRWGREWVRAVEGVNIINRWPSHLHEFIANLSRRFYPSVFGALLQADDLSSLHQKCDLFARLGPASLTDDAPHQCLAQWC